MKLYLKVTDELMVHADSTSYYNYWFVNECLETNRYYIKASDDDLKLLSLLKENYYWEDKNIYLNKEKICKIYFLDNEIEFNPNFKPDSKVMEIFNNYKFIWRGKEYPKIL